MSTSRRARRSKTKGELLKALQTRENDTNHLYYILMGLLIQNDGELRVSKSNMLLADKDCKISGEVSEDGEEMVIKLIMPEVGTNANISN